MIDREEHIEIGNSDSEALSKAEPENKRQKGSRKGWNRFWNASAGLLVVLFAALWVAGLFDRVIMPLTTTTGAEVKIPELRGLSFSEAREIGAEKNLEIVRTRNRTDNNFEPGTVVDQFPLAGSVVKPGRRIEVVLSVREQLLLCPDVIGKSPREAILIADSTGLAIDESQIRYRHSNYTPAGVVMSQRPRARTGMMKGDTITIAVSLGKASEVIRVPDLTGRRIDDLELVLAKYGLKLGRTSRYPTNNASHGTVISQTPDPGTEMRKGARVHVQIAVKPGGG